MILETALQKSFELVAAKGPLLKDAERKKNEDKFGSTNNNNNKKKKKRKPTMCSIDDVSKDEVPKKRAISLN